MNGVGVDKNKRTARGRFKRIVKHEMYEKVLEIIKSEISKRTTSWLH
jgi:hypothetical protein